MNCPKCGNPNDDSFKFCQFCSAGLVSESATPAEEAPPPAEQTAEQTAQPTQPVYPPYTPPYTPPPAPTAKKGCSKGILIALIVILVLIILGGGAVWALTRVKGEDKPTETTAQQETTVAQTEEDTEEPQETTNAAETEPPSQPSTDEIFGILGAADLANWDGNWNSLTDEQKQAIESYYAGLGEQIQFGPNGLVIVDQDGTYILGGQWPDNPLLKDVPTPAYGTIFSTSIEENEVVVTFSGWNSEQLVNYIAQVKAAGFTKDANEVNLLGMATYEAHNGKVLINVAQLMGFYAITVTKM